MSSVKTLYELTKFSVRLNYRRYWKKVDESLPRIIVRELLEDWFRCIEEEEIDFSDNELENFYTSGVDWQSLQPISTETFIMLMELPYEVPSFVLERNHVVIDYHQLTVLGCEESKSLCLDCYVYMSKCFEEYAENYWKENGWIWQQVRQHELVCGEQFLEKILWKRENWCSECIIRPLFDILDEEDCQFESSLLCKRLYFEEDYYVTSTSLVRASYVTPKRFKQLKEMGRGDA